MIEIFPEIKYEFPCLNCGTQLIHNTIHWQGVHVCTDSACPNCKKEFLVDLPINQASISLRALDKQSGEMFDDKKNKISKTNTAWFDDKLKTILTPSSKEIKVTFEKREDFDNVLFLNTTDFVYGHSLLLLMNIQRLQKLNQNKNQGIVLIVQPTMKWLIPEHGIAEVWTVDLKFNEAYNYYPSVSNQINAALKRFKYCELSNGYVLPTNENIAIENYSKIKPYSFEIPVPKPRITFIWRQDPGRIWVRNIYVVKVSQKLGFKTLLLPVHYLRIRILFILLRKVFKDSNYQLSLAGMGNYGKFPNYVDDRRVNGFSTKEEIDTCKVYAESELVIGVHGSSMLLPSAHAGMVVSMMPTKRWGNFAEDLLYQETDPRIALFQRRVIPLNLSIRETVDICVDMIKGRKYFMKKFIHSNIDL